MYRMPRSPAKMRQRKYCTVLRESLREPAFARVLAQLVSGDRLDVERKDTRRFASNALAKNGEGR